MNAEQITTIISNLFTGTGVVFFVGMVIRGLKNQIDGLKTQIGTLKETVEVQKNTLEAMKTQVSETEKIGSMYRKLFEELPTEVEKWKTAILKLKDERIDELEKANQAKDEKLSKTVEIEIEKLNLQQQALEDVPRLRGELISIVNTLQQRLSTVNQLSSDFLPNPHTEYAPKLEGYPITVFTAEEFRNEMKKLRDFEAAWREDQKKNQFFRINDSESA